MNNQELSSDQQENIRNAHICVAVGLGALVLEGAVLVAEAKDVVDIGHFYHLLLPTVAAGLILSSWLHLRDIRRGSRISE